MLKFNIEDTTIVEKEKKKNRAPYSFILKCYLSGVLTVLPWNLMINTLPSLVNVIFFDSVAQQTLIANVALTTSFNCAAFAGSVVIIYVTWRSRYFVLLVVGVTILLIVLFVVSSLLMETAMNVILSLLLGCLGVCLAFLSTLVLSTCTNIDSVLPGAADAAQGGIGLSGMLCFGLWLLSTQVVFINFEELYSIQLSIITNGCLIIMLSLICAYCFYSIITDHRTKNICYSNNHKKNLQVEENLSFKSESLNTPKNSYSKTSVIKLTNPEETITDNTPNSNFVETQLTFTDQVEDEQGKKITKTESIISELPLPNHSSSFAYGSFIVPITIKKGTIIDDQSYDFWKVLNTTKFSVLNIFVTIFITCTLFPNIAPLKWTDLTTTEQDLGVGMSQIGVFIGRGFPILCPKIHETPRWIVLIVIWARTLFFPIFYLFTLPTVVKLLYMLILSTSSGLILSVESFYACKCAQPLGVLSQSKAAGFCVSSINFGIAIGSVVAIGLVQI